MSGSEEDVIYGWGGEESGDVGQWASLEKSRSTGAVTAEHGSDNIAASLGFIASPTSFESQGHEDI
jgi:hypothetical protein